MKIFRISLLAKQETFISGELERMDERDFVSKGAHRAVPDDHFDDMHDIFPRYTI